MNTALAALILSFIPIITVEPAGPQVPVGEVITFDVLSSNLPEGTDFDDFTWKWDFGDGSGAIGDKVAHRFREPGEYLVLLEVYAVDGRIAHSGTILEVMPLKE